MAITSLQALMDRFLTDVPSGRLKTFGMVHVEGCWCVALAEGRFALINERSCFENLSGVMSGKWNVHARVALEGLQRLNVITVEEHDRLARDLQRREATARRREDVESARARASALGYELVKKRPIKKSRARR